MVDHASAIPAGLLAESAGDPALADAGGPSDQKPFRAVDPVAGDEPLKQGAVDAARGSQVDVLDDGVLPHRCVGRIDEVPRLGRTSLGVL